MRTIPTTDAPLRMRRSRILMLVIVAALVLGACGGDDAADEPTIEDTAGTDTTAAVADNTDAPATDSGTDGNDGTDSTTVDLGNIPSGDCAAIAMQWSQAVGGAMGGGSGASADDYDEIFEALGDTVPSELRGDVAVLADAYGQMARILEEAGGDFMALADDPAAMAVLEGLDTPEMQAAGDRLSAYFDEACPDS